MDVYGFLSDEPHNLRVWEIAELTDLQVVAWYGRPRNEKTGRPHSGGRYKDRWPSESVEDVKAKYLAMGQAVGLKLPDLEAAWAGWEEKERAKRGH